MTRTNKYIPTGMFAGRLEGYISYKREELNHKATHAENCYVPSFDRFCQERFPEKRDLDMELALAWVAEATTASAAINRASFMREFARYLILMGQDAFVLPRKATPIYHGANPPHIFSQAELDSFFAAAVSLLPDSKAGFRHLIAPVYFSLLYCAGLRPWEARVLTVEDVDLEMGIIHVMDSKGKDRDVPLNAEVVELCRVYSETMGAILPGRKAYFPNGSGTGFWSCSSMEKAFWRCWKNAGITQFSGPKPRPYDLRHTFATECICRWKSEGASIDGNLRFLQAYMGHDRIERTLYYVHLVRGGFGDPTGFETWKPVNRMKEEGHYGETQGR